jgi:hypothetical protein
MLITLKNEMFNVTSNVVESWYVAQMGVKRNTYRFLVGKLEGERPVGRPRRR